MLGNSKAAAQPVNVSRAEAAGGPDPELVLVVYAPDGSAVSRQQVSGTVEELEAMRSDTESAQPEGGYARLEES